MGYDIDLNRRFDVWDIFPCTRDRLMHDDNEILGPEMKLTQYGRIARCVSKDVEIEKQD